MASTNAVKARQIHGNGVVHRDAQLVGHHLCQLGHAALAEGGVDLVGFSIPHGLGVTGDADAVDVAVHSVHSYQNVGVAVAVAVVRAGDQDGVEAALALQVGTQGLLGRLFLRGLAGNPCPRTRAGTGSSAAFCSGAFRKKAFTSHADGEQDQDDDQKDLQGAGLLPLTAAGSSGHMK